MGERWYVDTSIWMDLYDDRKGYRDEPLGDFAWKLMKLIKERENKLIITDHLMRELEVNYSLEQINGMFKLFADIIEKIIVKKEQREEARKIAVERNVPFGDILHAVIARDHKLILIARDKHFKQLEDLSNHYKPEEFI